MRRRHRAAERVGQRVVDLADDMVEGSLLIEAPHIDRPFDRRTGSADGELSRGLARDRDHAAINFRRVWRVHRDLGFARLLALLQRRIIEEGKAHGALDLEGAVAGEEHGCRVRIDPQRLISTVGSRIGEEAEDLLLVVRVLAHRPKLLAPHHAIRG